MKYIVLLTLFLVGCAKPIDPKNNPNPTYASVSSVINGAETSCQDCLILEVQSNVIRVSFGTNPIEVCANEGTRSYYSNATVEFPTDTQQNTQWSGQSVEGSSNDPTCFPDNLILDFYWDVNYSPSYYDLNYLGKSYKIRKIN